MIRRLREYGGQYVGGGQALRCARLLYLSLLYIYLSIILGSQSTRSGKMTSKAMPIRMSITNGITPRMISATVTPNDGSAAPRQM